MAVPPGTLKTAYRIGKGFLTDEEVAEWEKLGKPVEATRLRPPAPSRGAAGKRPLLPRLPASEPPVAIAPEPADQPEVHALLRQSDAYHAALYPAESNHLVDVAKLLVAQRSLRGRAPRRHRSRAAAH